MAVDTVFPPRDRTALAMRLNNLLAAPGFQAWMQGEPLDAGTLLYTAAGKPRVSVMSIAHLSDAERMFFVTMLLADLIAWMRQQPGTGSLRAVLYIDELFGYMPPVANPPSKQLLLTLLKQARAFGLGVVLSTQNPVDLDYKGLSNAGMWFVGRLQTEQDKARVMDGLAGASGSSLRPHRHGTHDRRPRQARVPDAQRVRERAHGVRDALGDVVSGRPDDARADPAAHGAGVRECTRLPLRGSSGASPSASQAP